MPQRKNRKRKNWKNTDAEIGATEKIAELGKEMAMQAEVDNEQLKELKDISLFARESALTKEMVEAMIKKVRIY